MVARLLRLRVALLLSVFRARFPVVARRVLLGLLAAGGAVLLAELPNWAARPLADRAPVDVILCAAVLGCAVLVPLFANRGHLEPRQFGQVPASPSTVAAALLATAPVSWPVAWLLVWAVSLAVLRPEWRSVWWAVLVAAVLAVLLAVVGARVASAASKLLVPRRSVGALRVTGTLLLLAALPVAVFAVTQALRAPGGTMTDDAAAVLGWTPFGAPAAGVLLAVQGDASGALARFGIALAAVLVLAAIWFPLVRRSLQSVERPGEASLAGDGLGWFERLPARPASAIGARALTYWARDPRYRVALTAIPFAPVLMLLALWVAGVSLESMALVPLPVILLLLGWSLHNDVSMDSTAIWSHVASGTRGRDDRAGRLTPVLLVGLPLVLVGSSITVTVMGDWRVLPAVLGMNLGILLAACGAASVFSALMPYPATRPGDSPFAQPAIIGTGSGLSQTLSMMAAAALAVPPVWVAASAIGDPTFGANVFALGFGAVYGAIVLTAGVLLGGLIFDRAGPELIAITQTFD